MISSGAIVCLPHTNPPRARLHTLARQLRSSLSATHGWRTVSLYAALSCPALLCSALLRVACCVFSLFSHTLSAWKDGLSLGVPSRLWSTRENVCLFVRARVLSAGLRDEASEFVF
jgi:hypothetical protein